MRLSRPASWHQNMPGHRLSARIREGRQNSRGRSHALPKAPKCRQAALNSRELWRIQLAVFLGCRDFLSAKSVISPRSSSFFARPCSFPTTCSSACAWKSISGMSCHLCSASAHQSRQSKAPPPTPPPPLFRVWTCRICQTAGGAGLAVRGKLCSKFLSICKLQNIAPDASPSAPLYRSASSGAKRSNETGV